MPDHPDSPTTTTASDLETVGPVAATPGLVSATSDLGTTVRAARRALDLRQEDVALVAGVGVRFVSELERGKATVRLAETLRVLDALGLTLRIEARGG